MYGCESWTLKKDEHQWIDAFELWCWRRLLRVLWTARRSKPVHPKGNQSWMFIGGTVVEDETPILRLPDAESWLIWKDPDTGKDWEQEEKGTTEDEMAGWHHRLDGHEFGWTPGVGDGQGGLACCSSWGHKELDTAEWTELNTCIIFAPSLASDLGCYNWIPSLLGSQILCLQSSDNNHKNKNSYCLVEVFILWTFIFYSRVGKIPLIICIPRWRKSQENTATLPGPAFSWHIWSRGEDTSGKGEVLNHETQNYLGWWVQGEWEGITTGKLI